MHVGGASLKRSIGAIPIRSAPDALANFSVSRLLTQRHLPLSKMPKDQAGLIRKLVLYRFSSLFRSSSRAMQLRTQVAVNLLGVPCRLDSSK